MCGKNILQELNMAPNLGRIQTTAPHGRKPSVLAQRGLSYRSVRVQETLYSIESKVEI